MRHAFALFVLLTVPARAQDSTAVEPLDARAFRVVYAAENPAFVGTMRAAEASSLPVLFGAVPVAWGVTLATDAPPGVAMRLTASEIGAGVLVFVLKNAIKRPRPYRALRDVQPRTRRHSADRVLDPHSFPSGHSALSFALATSVSLSAERWYVTVPALGYASGVALARVWHGVHYPLDIATGAAIGAASAGLVHWLAPRLGGEGDDAGTLVLVPIARVGL